SARGHSGSAYLSIPSKARIRYVATGACPFTDGAWSTPRCAHAIARLVTKSPEGCSFCCLSRHQEPRQNRTIIRVGISISCFRTMHSDYRVRNATGAFYVGDGSKRYKLKSPRPRRRIYSRADDHRGWVPRGSEIS